MTRYPLAAHRACVLALVLTAAGCRDEPTAPARSEAAIPTVLAFDAALSRDWDSVYIRYAVRPPLGLRRLRVELPTFGATLVDTVFPTGTTSDARKLRILLAPQVLEAIRWHASAPVRLTVLDGGGLSYPIDATAPHRNMWVFGMISGYDYNLFHAVGDTISVTVRGNASTALEWLGLIVGDNTIHTSDSVLVTDSVAEDHHSARTKPFRLVMTEKWVSKGPGYEIPLGWFAWDVVGQLEQVWYATVPLVVPGRHVTTVGARAPLPARVGTVLVDESRNVAYLFWWGARQVGVLDLTNVGIRRMIPLGGAPGWPTLSLTGDSLIIPDRDRPVVQIVDVRTGERSDITITDVGHFETPRTPWAVAETANGHLLVTMGFTPDGLAWLVDVNLATGEQRRRTEVGDGRGYVGDCGMFVSLHAGAKTIVTYMSADGRRGAAFYDAATDQFVDVRPWADALCYGPTQATPDGSHLLIGNQLIDRATGERIILHPPFALAGDQPYPLPPSDLAADGRTVYIPTDYGLAVASIPDGKVLDRVLTPTAVPGTEFSPTYVHALRGGSEALVLTATEAFRIKLR